MRNYPVKERLVVVPAPKIVINFPKTYEMYPVKENPICSAVSEILGYKQTNILYFMIRIYFMTHMTNSDNNSIQVLNIQYSYTNNKIECDI